MELTKRIHAFVELGKRIQNLTLTESEFWRRQAHNQNNWFTEESIKLSLQGITHFLEEKNLKKWLSDYQFKDTSPQKVGLITAGNIPLVGFHDMLCILISGHFLKVKLSSQDEFLSKQILKLLTEIEPAFTERIEIAEMLKNSDVYIATGSDNSARYFEYYFAKFPHIIRKNRTSVAVLTNEETEEDLLKLGQDIISYFGLGCRNVAKLFVPENYDFQLFMKVIEENFDPNQHHKYRNNYDYNKSIYLVNSEPHLDNEQILVREDTALVSPISVVFYERYISETDLNEKLARDAEKIQCVVSKSGNYERGVSFGKAQTPELWDYADGVDTMAFLTNL